MLSPRALRIFRNPGESYTVWAATFRSDAAGPGRARGQGRIAGGAERRIVPGFTGDGSADPAIYSDVQRLTKRLQASIAER
jgi:hypothetical protein